MFSGRASWNNEILFEFPYWFCISSKLKQIHAVFFHTSGHIQITWIYGRISLIYRKFFGTCECSIQSPRLKLFLMRWVTSVLESGKLWTFFHVSQPIFGSLIDYSSDDVNCTKIILFSTSSKRYFSLYDKDNLNFFAKMKQMPAHHMAICCLNSISSTSLSHVSSCVSVDFLSLWMFSHTQSTGAVFPQYATSDASLTKISAWMFCCILHTGALSAVYASPCELSDALFAWMFFHKPDTDVVLVYHGLANA